MEFININMGQSKLVNILLIIFISNNITKNEKIEA